MFALLRAFVFLAAAALLWAASPSPARAETAGPLATLERIYLTAFGEAIGRHATTQLDGTTYVSTGDIEAEWLRDSSAVVAPYVPFAATDPKIGLMLRGVVARHAKYILIDPYANAFSADYRVAERKFEVDSLLYPIWFAHRYWRETGDRTIFTGEVNRAFERVLTVFRAEQHHVARSPYRHPQLAESGRGSPVGDTGMIWTGFRPSDDPARYHFNIPVNMFAVVAMRDLAEIERNVYHNALDAAVASTLADSVQRGIEQFGVVTLPDLGKIYAYEVDGLGHANLMDDANIPSLVSVPYFGYLSQRDSVYQATRRFALSARNPYYFVGAFGSGIGSPHTPRGYVWPLALVMQALTSSDPREINAVAAYIAASDSGDHRLHESYDINDPMRFTRADFAWPNALYAELVHSRGGNVSTAFTKP
jgi:meiotically up-regulated gene 157 (Mug157) protein